MAFNVKVKAGLNIMEYIDGESKTSFEAIDRAIDHFGGCIYVRVKDVDTSEVAARFIP